MNNETQEQLEVGIASAHQEINLLRCRMDATGALIIVYAVMIGFNFSNWVSLGVAVLASMVYGFILWRTADKPFEKLMNS